MSATKTHPLEHSWTLWYDSKKTVKAPAKKAEGPAAPAAPSAGAPAAAENWEENLVSIDTVNSVEAFWIMLKHTKAPSSLELSSNYHFFKKGVKPMWEDPANVNGGKWALQVTSKEDLYRIDSLWDDLMMAMIGEYLDEGVNGDHVVGAVLSKRRNAVKLSLWLRDASAKDEVDKLGKKLVEVLKVDPAKTGLSFLPHGAAGAQA